MPSNSPSSSSFFQDPSTVDDYAFPWAPHHQQALDQRSYAYHHPQWPAETEACSYLAPESSNSLPLYAPVPLPGTSSVHLPNIESCDSNIIPFAPSNGSEYTPVPGSFPTPCELLSELNRDTRSSDGASPDTPSSHPPCSTDASSTVSCLTPPEPEIMTSHEKKRQYLECLEQYVLYLHEQLRLVRAEPVPIEQVSTFHGLTSRSVRTLLVHMEKKLDQLNAKTRTEEQRFLALRDACLRQDGAAA